MKDLRSGVTLKKTNFVDERKSVIKYEPTPYESLMSDIRARNFKLNHVVNPPTNREGVLKKNAHDVIMAYIKSRPPLRPALKRILSPR